MVHSRKGSGGMKCKIGMITLSIICGSSGYAVSSESTNNQSNSALHSDWIDTSVSPAHDFYSYANGNWQKNNPIPPEYASWGSFNLVSDKVRDIIHQMLIKASENTEAKPGSIEQKVGDFYYSGMDEQSINQLGVTPLKSEFTKIDEIKTLQDLQNELIQQYVNLMLKVCQT